MIKNRLKEILAKKNIKQTSLVEITNLTKSTISNIVNNKFEPSVDAVFKIASFLSMPIEEIFYDEDEFLNYVAEAYLEYAATEYKERALYKITSTMVFDEGITKEEIKKRIQSIKSLNATILSIDRLE